jgi:drug/metabolite transporter (DMT)-like permease
MVIIFLLYLSMASTFTLGKLALGYAHPFFLIATRMLGASALLLGLQYWRTRNISLPVMHWAFFIRLALFHIYFAFVPEFWALHYVSGAQACLIYCLSPFVTALLNYYFVGKKLTRTQLSGLTIGFLGFLPMIYDYNGLTMFFSLPQIALLISVCSASYGWLLLRKASVDLGYTLTFSNGLSMLIGGLLAGITTLCVPNGFSISPMAASPSVMGTWLITTMGAGTAGVIMFLGYTLLLILIANIFFYNMYGYLLKDYSATFLSFAGFTTPVFAALFDWIFWGLIPPWYFWGTFCMVAIGLYIFYQDEF